MDVGCSSSLDTYSIVENANYSFVELPLDTLAEIKDENFQDLIDKVKSFKIKPLVWSDLSEEYKLGEYAFSYVKKHIKDLCQKIDMLNGEYITVRYEQSMFNTAPDDFVNTLIDISSVASSYGLEIILLINGKNIDELVNNYKTISDLSIDHPFLKYGVDFSGINDYDRFFDFVADNEVMGLESVIYYRISANDSNEDNFSEKLSGMINKLADLNAMLCVWNNLDETLHKIMSNKYIYND